MEHFHNEDPIFTYARALKAFEATTGCKLRGQELTNAFSLWWQKAAAHLPPDSDYDECRFLFENAFEKARSPLGANHFEEARKRVLNDPLPPEAKKYDSPRLRTLASLCYHLQALSYPGEFFLSVRSVADLLSCSNQVASAMLRGLERDSLLQMTQKGVPGRGKATRFRFVGYLPPEDRPDEDPIAAMRSALK